MKGLSEEYYIETKVSVKKGIKLKRYEDTMPHPMCGAEMKYTVRACPHKYIHPSDMPFKSVMDMPLCPHGCFIVTREGKKPKVTKAQQKRMDKMREEWIDVWYSMAKKQPILKFKGTREEFKKSLNNKI